MEILVIGEPVNLEETRKKFGDGHHYRGLTSRQQALPMTSPETIAFDFLVDEDLSNLDVYNAFPGLCVFLNTVTISLTQLSSSGLRKTAFGFCGIPTFLDREILEVSLQQADQQEKLKDVCRRLQTKYQVVADRTGLVTPRVICMIINEAYRTEEEGTATRGDIDVAMKLGTNYPFGPFEWGERIGFRHVVRLLEAVHRETGDDRYKVCDLLRKESLIGRRE